MPLKCILVTPEQQMFDEAITQAIVPAHDGLLGILVDRAPALIKLGLGPLRLDTTSGKSLFFLIEGGVAQMKSNKLTILTNSAVASTEIKADAAKAEYEAAVAKHATDEKSAREREEQIARARAKQHLAGASASK